jgi:hypothetical protein
VTARGRHPAALAALAALLLATAEPHGDPLERATCSLEVVLADLRGALADGSPALQRYVQTLLKEAALRLPVEELRAALAAERDPRVLEALGVALATRASNAGQPALIGPILERARADQDPALRAAALRGLRGVGSVEMMQQARAGSYAELVRDPSPEVRAAVADNLIHESAAVYFGHDAAVSDAAVAAAAASPDPALAARLLAETSMERAGAESVTALVEQLAAADATVRAAAARALGGVSGAHADPARRALVARYGPEGAREVQVAILEGLVHLGLSGARPLLESLRAVHPDLTSEIDAWLQVLAMNLQEWSIVLREKQRLQS